jgi:hypothetical protein
MFSDFMQSKNPCLSQLVCRGQRERQGTTKKQYVIFYLCQLRVFLIGGIEDSSHHTTTSYVKVTLAVD